MAGFDENINIDVYRFREIVRSLFNGLNLSDGAILNRIEENRRELFEYYCFKSDLENLIGKDLTNGNAIAEIKRLQQASDDVMIDSIYELRTERTYYRNILDHLCDQLGFHGADGFDKLKNINIESRSQQVLGVNEIKEKEFDSLLKEVTKLKNDLRIANKVVARLVGE